MRSVRNFVISGLSAGLVSTLVVAPEASAAGRAATPANDPAQTTCVVEGPDILEANAQPCGTLAVGAPGIPTAVRTRVTGPDSIRLRWQAPTGRRARTYSVYAFTGTEGTLVCKVNRLRCTASNLEVDEEYVFYVVASNKAGSGAASVTPPVYLPADASPDGFR